MNLKQVILCCSLSLPGTATAAMLESFGTLLTTAAERREFDNQHPTLPVDTDEAPPAAPLAPAVPRIELRGFVLRSHQFGTVWYNDTSTTIEGTLSGGILVAPASCQTACIRVQAADGKMYTLRAGESTHAPRESPDE